MYLKIYLKFRYIFRYIFFDNNFSPPIFTYEKSECKTSKICKMFNLIKIRETLVWREL